MYAVKEYGSDGSYIGYCGTSPMSKEQADKWVKTLRKWAKDDDSGRTYKVVELELDMSIRRSAAAATLGSIRSERKAAASRANGATPVKPGSNPRGRPRKATTEE